MSQCPHEAPLLLPSHQQLIVHLESERIAVTQLAKLLDKENSLLKMTQEEMLIDLNEVVEHKQACINQLEENAQQRDLWTELAQQQIPEDKPLSVRQKQAIKQKRWLKLLDDELIEKWNKIEQFILICKRLNSINGRLIGFRRQRNKRIEELLFGNSPATTYSASGTAINTRGYQNSIRA